MVAIAMGLQGLLFSTMDVVAEPFRSAVVTSLIAEPGTTRYQEFLAGEYEQVLNVKAESLQAIHKLHKQAIENAGELKAQNELIVIDAATLERVSEGDIAVKMAQIPAGSRVILFDSLRSPSHLMHLFSKSVSVVRKVYSNELTVESIKGETDKWSTDFEGRVGFMLGNGISVEVLQSEIAKLGVTFQIDSTQLQDSAERAKLFEIISFAASLEPGARARYLEQAVAFGLFQNQNGVFTLGQAWSQAFEAQRIVNIAA